MKKIDRYAWAGEVARIALGKKRIWGEKPIDVATDDPLAWWCLTECIVTGKPFQEPFREQQEN